ncbi:hypothetical protein [Mycobacterium ulcerans]|uniref:hypothetical protein n=1 Tax=Mycobacterium ulcerans TaxID=1809 RepID=UPI001F0800C9|nr:hypothetical protein [Mycobacterium ulcerans]
MGGSQPDGDAPDETDQVVAGGLGQRQQRGKQADGHIQGHRVALLAQFGGVLAAFRPRGSTFGHVAHRDTTADGGLRRNSPARCPSIRGGDTQGSGVVD